MDRDAWDLTPDSVQRALEHLVPASAGKVVREVTPEHIARMRDSAEQYVRNAERYRRGLRVEEG